MIMKSAKKVAFISSYRLRIAAEEQMPLRTEWQSAFMQDSAEGRWLRQKEMKKL
jgi:hypothetical protein